MERNLAINLVRKSELEKEMKSLADEIRVRLGINPLSFDAFVEVSTKNPQCCSIS